MPKHATSTSFKKGNKAALGNDKTLRVSTWIERELEKPLEEPKSSVLGYENQMARSQAVAKRLVDFALDPKDNDLAMSAIKEIIDRTEGKPQQPVKHSGDEEHPIRAVFVKPAKLDELPD